MEKNIAIIFAGGIGVRMGRKDLPKQFLEINGKPIIIYTIEHFERHPEIDEIYIACVKEWIDYLNNLLKKYQIKKVRSVIAGGKTGQESIYLALREASRKNSSNSVVLIHDGVRPYITPEVISNNIKSVKENGNAISVVSATETILISKDGNNICDIPVRKEVLIGQAPQSFRLGEILEAHEEIRKSNPNYDNVSDSATLYNMLGKKLYIVKGNKGNLKVTDPIDYYILSGILSYADTESVYSAGNKKIKRLGTNNGEIIYE